MQKITLYGFLWAIAALALVTCAPVKELDDRANIKDVKAEVLTPSAVILGVPQVDQDNIFIPLIFGKYLFPIDIQIEINTQQRIDKVLGLGAGKILTFESLDDIHRIDLIALSGVVHSYLFCLQEVPSRESADIEKFEITSWTPEQCLFTRTPYYDMINGCIELIGINNPFPFTIVPDITVSDGAYITDWNAGNRFTFTSFDSSFPLTIVAESGRERVWQIRMKQANIIQPAEAPNADIRERLSLNPQTISAQLSNGDAECEVKSIEVDTDKSIIRLSLAPTDYDATWEARLSFPVHSYAQIVGYIPEEPFMIQGIGLQQSFYIVDILDGYATQWTIESVLWYNPAAEIESFDILNYTSEYEMIGLSAPVVYPALATVEIPVEKGFDFPLTINSYQYTISNDASVVEPLPIELVFYDFDTSYTVTIKAQNGDTKTWSITLADTRSGSNEARVTGYSIASYSGTSQTNNNIVLQTQAAINTQNRTITLHILDWANKLPLSVMGHVDISSGAVLFPFTFSIDHELIFHTLDDVFTFTVVSENGETEQTWTILLQDDAPVRSNAKEVIDFVSGAPSSGFLLAEKYLEPEKKQITLIVKDRISGSSLILAPRIVLSPDARLLGIVSGAQLSLSFDQPRTFTVQAEDETTQEWQIVLVYAPQIPNSDFESWGRANNSDMNLLPANGTGWCTANNSSLTNTFRVAGYNSPYAAQIQTLLQTLNFVIFKVTTIAAGTAFVGKFTLKTGANDVYNPISMTNMGLPYSVTPMPVAFSIDYKYVRGAQLMYTQPNWGSLIPSFKSPVNIPGTDAASLRVELFYHPIGTFDYVTACNRNEMIAKGEILESNNVPDWTHAYIPIEVLPGKEGLPPTHIAIVLTSSYEGDYFRGAPGSTLTADNLKLIYYEPEVGATYLD